MGIGAPVDIAGDAHSTHDPEGSEPSLAELELAMGYATNTSDVIREFYEPCLMRAHSYDRAVGYFRSTILLLTARPVAHFAENGGRIRIVCSPELTEGDIEGLRRGYTWRDLVEGHLATVLDEAVATPSGKSCVEYLANLVANGCLDLKIAFRVGSRGIFHAKTGIFSDNVGNAVSFTGSANETFAGWDPQGNHESIDVFCSWRAVDQDRVPKHAEYFNRLWASEEPGVVTVDFPEVAADRLRVQATSRNPTEIVEELEVDIGDVGPTLRTHQAAALESWRAHEFRGVLAHATGSGKTITALAAIKDWISEGRPALVVVPSTLLLDQWLDEARKFMRGLPDLRILLVGGGNNQWRKADVLGAYTQPDGAPRLVIATMQTASTSDFLGRVIAGPHLLLVTDEVHRIGAPQARAVMDIEAGGRLGMSATPERYGDPEGTAALFDYFGETLNPIYTLNNAIADGVLCPYQYVVHRIFLDDGEVARWRKLTMDIVAEVARSTTNDGAVAWTEYTKFLLIRRARILKRAGAKVGLAVDVIGANARPGDRWLIYCDSQAQLRDVRDALLQSGISTLEYHSAMSGDREATLKHFELVGGVMVAIKCLDEGVDIPAIDRALILASSRNPREFIQRRGRILRRSPGKAFAVLHDALVFPPLDTMEPMDAGIAAGELIRAQLFASGATNDSVRFKLRQFMLDIGLDPDNLEDADSIEEDDDD